LAEEILTLNELRKVVKEVVEEVVRKEILNLRISLLPYVSDEEQKEIESACGKCPESEEVVYEEDVEI